MKKWLLLSLLLLVTSNVFWLYIAFDRAITRTYELADYDSLQIQHQQLIRLANLEVIGKDKQTVLDMIGQDAYGLDPFVKDDCINVAQICIGLENDIAVEIKPD